MANPETLQEKPTKRARFGNVEVAEELVSDGNEVVTFHLVESLEDWQNGEARKNAAAAFKPEYTHQVFSDEEEVKGYKDLSVEVFINAQDFTAMAEVSYARKEKAADDINNMMAEAFDGSLLQGEEAAAQFEESLQKSRAMQVTDYGQEVECLDLDGGNAELVITRANLATAPEELRALHARMEPLLLFFVDGASGIDSTDPAWDLFVALRRNKNSGQVQVMGFLTVHSYYAYPDSRRLQVSQVLVLSPHRRQGIASRLLKAVMQAARSQDVKDVTYEDPSPEIERLRERGDLQACKAAAWILEAAAACAQKAADALASADLKDTKNAEKLLAPPEETIRRAQKELKISRTWFKRVWEGLLLPHIKTRGDSAMAAMIGYIKTRMGIGEGDSKDVQSKRTWETSTGFVMAKTKANKGVAPILEEPEMSEQERAERVAEAVGERLQLLDALLAANVTTPA